MVVDPARYRRKVLLDLAAHPATLLPAVLGMTSLLAGWAFSDISTLGFAGVVGLLVAAGATATRWLLGRDTIFRRAYDELQEEAEKTRNEQLDALDRRLREDNDPRPEALLADLRTIYQGFRENGEWSRKLADRSAVEIASTVEKLFQGCIAFLERTAELWETARKLRTDDARRHLLETRESILAEIGRSIQQLAKTIDGVMTLTVTGDEADALARLRGDLDANLEVARKVEQRMQSLESEMRHAEAARE
jgi:hypothetical protein